MKGFPELRFEEDERGTKRLWLSGEFTMMEISQYVSELELEADGRETRVKLTFPMVHAALELRNTVAEVSRGTHEALVAMGWTPPE